MNTTPEIFNSHTEKIDVLVEGNNASPITVVMVHGLGVDKHETAGMFDDIAASLIDTYRVVRFDFSGFGKSEGRTEDFNYIKHADDLKAVLEYVKKTYKGTVFILAQSMGTFVTSLLCPMGITKTVFTGIPNSNTEYIIERVVKRFGVKLGAVVNQNGISIIPRSSGAVQKWGPSFWKVLREFKPVDAVSNFSKNTNLYIIHPLQDEVVGPEYQKDYDAIANIKIEWINGDHSFKKPEDRTVLIEKIRQFFS
jgi:hypothetical protein